MNKDYKMLGLAIEIATRVYSGQFDKNGKPYILHPLRVMNSFMLVPQLATIAMLHNVVNDSNVTLSDLKSTYGFDDRIMNALTVLTRSSGDTYEEYISKISTDSDASKIAAKYLKGVHDLFQGKDGCDEDSGDKDRYHAALNHLRNANINHKLDYHRSPYMGRPISLAEVSPGDSSLDECPDSQDES